MILQPTESPINLFTNSFKLKFLVKKEQLNYKASLIIDFNTINNIEVINQIYWFDIITVGETNYYPEIIPAFCEGEEECLPMQLQNHHELPLPYLFGNVLCNNAEIEVIFNPRGNIINTDDEGKSFSVKNAQLKLEPLMNSFYTISERNTKGLFIRFRKINEKNIKSYLLSHSFRVEINDKIVPSNQIILRNGIYCISCFLNEIPLKIKLVTKNTQKITDIFTFADNKSFAFRYEGKISQIIELKDYFVEKELDKLLGCGNYCHYIKDNTLTIWHHDEIPGKLEAIGNISHKRPELNDNFVNLNERFSMVAVYTKTFSNFNEQYKRKLICNIL